MSAKKNGRPKRFETIEEFEQGCYDYIQWVKDTPQQKTITASFQGEITDRKVNFQRPMTIYGLATHLKISTTALQDYGSQDGFSTIYKEVRAIMTAWNVDGAISGDLNHAIVARIEGLVDKQEVSSNSSEKPLTINLVSPNVND